MSKKVYLVVTKYAVSKYKENPARCDFYEKAFIQDWNTGFGDIAEFFPMRYSLYSYLYNNEQEYYTDVNGNKCFFTVQIHTSKKSAETVARNINGAAKACKSYYNCDYII